MELVIATRNRGKLEEIVDLLKDFNIKVTSLLSYPDIGDILEDGEGFLENAKKKAQVVSHATRKWCLADDSGLVVKALGGAPGVKSARYAGKQGDHKANNKKLLKEMKNVPEDKRNAYFTCTMVLISPAGAEWDVEERCNGVIGRELQGERGFGYDPLFFLPEKGCTMAELDLAEKNEISHRGKALRHIRGILEDLLKRGKI
jgi:XTP/dITP diphosphohydrolase